MANKPNMNGNKPPNLKSPPEFHKDIMDEQTRIALEENIGLKSYIESMNNECLELNAALFEEANKMVKIARSKQTGAERQANEKAAENEALRSQVEELRAVIASLPSPLSSNKAATIPPIPRSPSKWHRRSKKRQDVQTRETPVYRMSVEDLRLLVPSSSDSSTLTTVGRGTLLNALLANEDDAEDMDLDTFKMFVEWTKMDFPLCLPVQMHSQKSKRHVNVVTDSGNRVVIVHESQNDCNGSSEEKEEVNDGSDADEAPSSVLSYSQQGSRSCAVSQFELASTETGRCCDFIQRLFEYDIRPCLHFAERSITLAIYQALPTMALEMVPLDHRCFLHASGSFNDASNMSGKTCPLLPQMDVHYRLTIRPPTLTGEADGVEKVTSVDISASARDRIAAVVSLFQYLSLIRRGLASSSGSRSVSLVNLNSSGSHRTLPSGGSSADLGKQFRRIQRLRLTIALARLGFGLPE